MGLLFPKWSWNEIQRKDAIMGELSRENDRQVDRLLDGMRSMAREQEDAIRRQQRIEQAETKAALYKSLSSIEKEAYKVVPKEAKKLYKDTIKSKMILGKYIDAIKTKPITSIGKSIYLFISVLFLISLFVMTIFNSNIVEPFIGDIAILNLLFLCLGIYKLAIYIIPSKIASRTIRKTKCYQELLKEIKMLNADDISYIGVNANCLRIIDNKNQKYDFLFSTYNFPNLPTDKYGILLSTLLKDTKLNKTLKLVIGISEKPQMSNMFAIYYYINNMSVNGLISQNNEVFSFSEQDYREYISL